MASFAGFVDTGLAIVQPKLKHKALRMHSASALNDSRSLRSISDANNVSSLSNGILSITFN